MALYKEAISWTTCGLTEDFTSETLSFCITGHKTHDYYADSKDMQEMYVSGIN